MTPLEYVEVAAVEQALYSARLYERSTRTPYDNERYTWYRYLDALSYELCQNGLDGVRLGHG